MQTRAATPDDYVGFCGFWRELGLEDAPPPRERWIAQLMPSTLFIADGTTLAAYGLSFGFGARGDVRQIAVDSRYRRRGVGRAMMAAVATRLRAAGCADWRLEVRARNAAARALYRAVGMRELHELHIVRIATADAMKLAATCSGRHAARVVAPDDDAALEAAHDLGRGQIERWRSIRPHCPILRVGELGLTQVRPDHTEDLALLFPFRAADADVAATLLAYALPLSAPTIEIVALGRTLAAPLIGAGAKPHDLQIEMGGAIPAAASGATSP